MSKKYLYKDRFFIEDDDFGSPDFFATSISTLGGGLKPELWADLSIGGATQIGLSYGFSLDDKEDREAALKTFESIHSGLSRFIEKLKSVCEERDKENEDKNNK